jgi:hypothetical protein
LLSAWHDKFSKKASASRQQSYLDALKVFEQKYEVKDEYVTSFEAFIELIAANPSDYLHNRHWRTIYRKVITLL